MAKLPKDTQSQRPGVSRPLEDTHPKCSVRATQSTEPILVARPEPTYTVTLPWTEPARYGLRLDEDPRSWLLALMGWLTLLLAVLYMQSGPAGTEIRLPSGSVIRFAPDCPAEFMKRVNVSESTLPFQLVTDDSGRFLGWPAGAATMHLYPEGPLPCLVWIKQPLYEGIVGEKVLVQRLDNGTVIYSPIRIVDGMAVSVLTYF